MATATATPPISPVLPVGTPPGALDGNQQGSHSPSNPMQGHSNDPQNSGGLTDPKDQQKLISIVTRYKQQWSQDRLMLMQRCLENIEFFKGNQFISFNPGNFQFFDVVNWYNTNHAQDSDDTDLYKFCSNFYQMLATAFVAALCPQIPKSAWVPEDADDLADVTTAKAAQTLIDIIERQNKQKTQLKQKLFYLFTCGAYFVHTRFVRDTSIGTHTEPIWDMQEMSVLPDRYHCFNCGTDNPASSMAVQISKTCQKCGHPLGDESFYPATPPVMMPVQTGQVEVANGMVRRTVYSPMEIDCDPAAMGDDPLSLTPILNMEVEVHVAALRRSYPVMKDMISAGATSPMSPNGSIDRIARQQVYSQTGTYSTMLQDQRPTLSRTWIQEWAFDLDDDPGFGDRMRAIFPKGCLLVNVGTLFLEARPAELTAEWTWAGTHVGLGIYPPSIGDVVVPFQKRFNDVANIIHEYMDRCSAGMTLANTDVIDTRSINGKPLLPGVLNPIKFKRTAPGQNFGDAIFQFKFTMEAEAFTYPDKLLYLGQMFAGVPPQVYGGAGDEHIETFGGQQQQMNAALGKLNIYWENLRDESAQSDELAVKCAADNMTEDMKNAVSSKGSEFRNDYVRLDDIRGQVRANPDTDQGFPITAAELRQRWMDIFNAAEKNQAAQKLLDVPANQVQAMTALGLPGAVIPGAAMWSKVTQVLEQLQRARPIPQVDPKTRAQAINPQTGQPMWNPSVSPDKTDDFDEARKIIKEYLTENWDLKQKKPQGWQNMLLYYDAVISMQTQDMAQAAQQQASIARAAAPPPDPLEQAAKTLLVHDAATAVSAQSKIGQTPPLPKGSSLQAQVAANKEIIEAAVTAVTAK